MTILSTIDEEGYSASDATYTYYIVTRTGQLLSSGTAFNSTGQVMMTIEGTVAGDSSGILLVRSYYDAYNLASYVNLTETGLVVGNSNYGVGVSFAIDGSELHNAGTIIGNTAVRFIDGNDIKLYNDGRITATPSLSIFATGVSIGAGEDALVNNTGLIEGTTALDINGTFVRIDNSGTLRGTSDLLAAVDISTVTTGTALAPSWVSTRRCGWCPTWTLTRTSAVTRCA